MRILSSSLSFLFVGVLLVGCGGSDTAVKDDKTLVDTNFDNLVGWVDNASGSLSKKFAHSGKYSLTVGGGTEYGGAAFHSPLGQITATKPRKLTLHGWVRTDEPNTPAQLVVQVTKPGTDEKVFWKGLPLSAGSKPGEWTELKADLVLPENVANDQILGVYLWGNSAGKPIFLDDLTIVSAE
ncbi:hypothetical protein GCM10022408_33230 [Hymenobacter fastidiosus]|uniref:CBM-cenC domain-containing protein n=1 Tax=Hymenobacter fastidiosus TaxID=486264 RepID=A0ABP7SV53_9BACT